MAITKALRASLAIITPSGFAIPSAVVVTQALWAGAAYGSPFTKCSGPAGSYHKYAITENSATTGKYLSGIGVEEEKPTAKIYEPVTGDKDFIDLSQWLQVDGNKTWFIEQGYTKGWWSSTPGTSYHGAFYDIDASPTIPYNEHMISLGGWPTKASSWYQFKTSQVTATQRSFYISFNVWSHNLGKKASSLLTRFSIPTGTKATKASAGLETTCGYSVTATGQTMNIVGQTYSDKSQGSWHNFQRSKTHLNFTGFLNPLYIDWYSSGDTGKKVYISEYSY
jgi:hypothetical protein